MMLMIFAGSADFLVYGMQLETHKYIVMQYVLLMHLRVLDWLLYVPFLFVHLCHATDVTLWVLLMMSALACERSKSCG